MSIKEFKNDKYSFIIIDGIVHCEWLQAFVDYDMVDSAIKKRIEIFDNKFYPMLSDLSKLKGGTREARQRLGGEDGFEGLTAQAIIVKTRVQMILFQIYHQIFRVPIPVKVFNNKEKAVLWLQQYKTTT